ncbi:unnamed protein product, partial [Rhizoctonia solani]
MLGRLQMPIEKAIAEYVKLSEDVFKDRKWNGSTIYKGTKLRDALRTMVRETTGNEAEMMNKGEINNKCKSVVFAMARHNLNADSRRPPMTRVRKLRGPHPAVVETSSYEFR